MDVLQANKLPRILFMPTCMRGSSGANRALMCPKIHQGGEFQISEVFNPFRKNFELNRQTRTSKEEAKLALKMPTLDQETIPSLARSETKFSIALPKIGQNSPYSQPAKSCLSEEDLTLKLGRNILIIEREGNKYVLNKLGQEFIYYENLEEVRRVLRSRHPGMSKSTMYKELLRPYLHQIINVYDENSGRLTKQVYQCGYDGCNKQFNKTWNLVDHLRMHEGIKPYRCHLCEKLFTQKGNLQKHMKQHLLTDVNDRKRYVCDRCGKGYTERYNCVVSEILMNMKFLENVVNFSSLSLSFPVFENRFV